MDMQEMVLWTSLNWRILKHEEIGSFYEKTSAGACFPAERSWEMCVERLMTRGLLVRGSGETEYDALYDLMGSLSIIPTGGSFGLRCFTFLKLVVMNHVPFSAAKKLFQADRRTAEEAQVMHLTRQALLDAIYDDADTTSNNIASIMKSSSSTKPVVLAVANLYLRQQIIFERV